MRVRRTIWLASVLALCACTSGETDAAPGAEPSPTATTAPWIAYQWGYLGGAHDVLFLVHPDGSDVHALLPQMRMSDLLDPDWSPDGRSVAFVVARGGRSDLWTVNVDGTDARLILTCSVPCNTMGKPDWSSDGRRILFTEDRFPLDDNGVPSTFMIRAVEPKSGAVTTLLTRHDGMTAEWARWSPDEARIVYMRGRLREDGTWESAVFVSAIGHDGEERLTRWHLSAVCPDWGQNDLIVFSSYDLAGFPDAEQPGNLFTIAPDGTGLRALTSFEASSTVATQPRWTSDGMSIIFTKVTRKGDPVAGRRTLAMIDADGSGLRPATAAALEGTHPALQPEP